MFGLRAAIDRPAHAEGDMSYLPYVPPADKTKLSPRARELSSQIEKVLQDFQRSYPDTRPGDVQDALRAASGGTDPAPDSRRLLAVTLAGGVAALVGVLFFMEEFADRTIDLPPGAMTWIVMSLVILVGIVALARRA